MKPFIPDDNDDDVEACMKRDISSYSGYLGIYYDGSADYGVQLAALDSFCFKRYHELIGDTERRLNIAVPSGTIQIQFSDDYGIPTLLDQLPTVDVLVDGEHFIFFQPDGITDAELDASISALIEALKGDLAALEQ